MGFQLYNAPYYGQATSGVEFFTGTTAVSSQVPSPWHVAIAGHNYMVDLGQPFYRQYRRQLAQLIRTQADTSKDPGEQTMDPNSLWRRSFEDPSLGAGQRYRDRQDSVSNRFFASKGVDTLTTRWQFSLLPDTTLLRSSANTNTRVAVVGTHIYVIDGQTLAYAASIGGAFTTVTGTPGSTASSIATDGFNVWVAYGTNGVYTTTEGAATATQYVTSAVDAAAVLGYCNGRLMLGSTNKIYNITASGALPAPLFTAGNPNMTYCGFAEGIGALYAGASAGSRSWIYGMTVTSDGLALGAPVIQGALPPGETAVSVYGALGGTFLIIGTSLGVRMCTTSTSGSVTLGALISGVASAGGLYGPTVSVQALAGTGRFVYFGWTNYDTASTGLGRLDLQNQVISSVLPAFSSDLMVTGQGAVTSVATYNGQPVLTVSGLGLYGPSTNLVASGSIDSGYILYDLVDSKVACLLDIEALGPVQHGSYSALVSTDNSTFNGVGTINALDPTFTHTFGVGPVTGQRFEVRIILNRDATPTLGPTITRWTLRSYPAPKRPRTWQLPLILNEQVTNRSGSSAGFDPLAELIFLEGLATNGRMVTFQEDDTSQPVFVQDVEFLPDYTMEESVVVDNYFNGIALVTLVGLPVSGAL